jgi:hypothetical protein
MHGGIERGFASHLFQQESVSRLGGGGCQAIVLDVEILQTTAIFQFKNPSSLMLNPSNLAKRGGEMHL